MCMVGMKGGKFGKKMITIPLAWKRILITSGMSVALGI